MTKKELRHDPVMASGARAAIYVQRHFMTVLLVIAVAAVVIVGGLYILQSRERSQVQASQLLHRAAGQYSQGGYTEALNSLDELSSRFAGTAEAKAAFYFSGASHLALGEHESATQKFREYLDLQPNGLYAGAARAGLAFATEGGGDLAAARAQYRDLREELDSEDPLLTQATFGEARVLEAMGQTDEASTVLETLLSSPDYAARQKAEGKIAVLKAAKTKTAS